MGTIVSKDVELFYLLLILVSKDDIVELFYLLQWYLVPVVGSITCWPVLPAEWYGSRRCMHAHTSFLIRHAHFRSSCEHRHLMYSKMHEDHHVIRMTS